MSMAIAVFDTMGGDTQEESWHVMPPDEQGQLRPVIGAEFAKPPAISRTAPPWFCRTTSLPARSTDGLAGACYLADIELELALARPVG